MSNAAKTLRLTVTAVLATIVAVISFLPLKTLGLEITFSMVPVAVGAILYGPAVGAVLGGVFGLVSFLQCLGYSGFGVILFSINPWLTLVVCLPTRILAGWLTGWIYKGLHRVCKKGFADAAVASLSAAVLNTLFFMTTLVLCFYHTEYIQGLVGQLHAPNPFVFVVLFVGINGLVEILAGAFIAFPVAKAMQRYLKKGA